MRNILQNIDKGYDKLDGKEKVSIESVYQQFRNTALNLMRNIVRMENEDVQIDEQGNIIEKVKPRPPAEDAPEGRPKPDVPIPAGEPGGAQPDAPVVAGPDISGGGTKLRSGKFTIVPVKQSVRGALNLLDELVSNPRKQLTGKREIAVTEIVQYNKLQPFLNVPRITTLINDLPPTNPERKASFINIVDDEIIKKVLVDVSPQ